MPDFVTVFSKTNFWACREQGRNNFEEHIICTYETFQFNSITKYTSAVF
jgi:hypothetical protein